MIIAITLPTRIPYEIFKAEYTLSLFIRVAYCVTSLPLLAVTKALIVELLRDFFFFIKIQGLLRLINYWVLLRIRISKKYRL